MKHACLLLACLLAGCERGMHDMYDQPKYRTQQPATMFADGNSARVAPVGSVPVGGAAALPFHRDAATLARGRERYDIYCAPCHGRAGYGDGMVVQRGFPAPPSYHDDRLRNAPDTHLLDVIANGYGVMYPYGDRVDEADRLAIVAYIRALQLSQHAPRARLAADDLHDPALDPRAYRRGVG
jgi:mono/diheme cytochrome c family protein